jgi:hypothetical protein
MSAKGASTVTRVPASLLGVVFFAVLAASIVTQNPPGTSSSAAKVLSYYTSHRRISEISGLLTVIAVVLGILFYGLLRDHLRHDETVRGLAATAFGGALLFGASGVVGAGALWALADSPSHLSPAAAQSLYLVNEDGSFAFASAGIALMLFAYGLAILKSHRLPAWLGWVAFPLALSALIPPAGFVALVGTGLWTLIASIAMYRRQSQREPVAAAPATA